VKPHRFHPEADEEYTAAATYYAAISRDLGGRFYDEIEGLIAEVRAAPQRFRRIDGGVRRHLARGFPYALLYLDQPEEIWIIAVLPLRREPDYWRQRIAT
jgi:plasmid stabilization system protein ParE